MVLSLKGRRYRFLGRYNHEKLTQKQNHLHSLPLCYGQKKGVLSSGPHLYDIHAPE